MLRRLWPATVGVTLCFLGFFAWGTWSIHQRAVTQVAELKAANERNNVVITELRKLTAPSIWVNEKEVMNTCTTDRGTVTCTFTNTQKFPITTCAQGLLYQKEASGVRLQALPMCTGKLMPAETTVVAGGWVAGFADDICNRDGYVHVPLPRSA
jgi:hypothetical protein